MQQRRRERRGQRVHLKQQCREQRERHEHEVEQRDRDEIHERPYERDLAEEYGRERQQRTADRPLQRADISGHARGAADARLRRELEPARRGQREQDPDRDEREPERRRQRREGIPDDDRKQRRSEDLERSDRAPAHEQRERDRDHQQRALRGDRETRERGVVRGARDARDRGDLEIEARERLRQPDPERTQHDEHEHAEHADVQARHGDEMARAGAPEVGPVLLGESIALPDRERRHERRGVRVLERIAYPLRDPRAQREPSARECRLHAQRERFGAHIARRTVSGDEQPLLVVEAAGIARAVRRAQPCDQPQALTGLDRPRRPIPREPHERRHSFGPRLGDRKRERHLSRREGRKAVDKARDRDLALRRIGRKPLVEPLLRGDRSPSERRDCPRNPPRRGEAQREQRGERERHIRAGARQLRELMHRERPGEPRARDHDDRRHAHKHPPRVTRVAAAHP